MSYSIYTAVASTMPACLPTPYSEWPLQNGWQSLYHVLVSCLSPLNRGKIVIYNNYFLLTGYLELYNVSISLPSTYPVTNSLMSILSKWVSPPSWTLSLKPSVKRRLFVFKCKRKSLLVWALTWHTGERASWPLRTPVVRCEVDFCCHVVWSNDGDSWHHSERLVVAYELVQPLYEW